MSASYDLSEADRWRAWDRFLEATPEAGFMQSSSYADFRASVGYECFGIVIRDAEEIVGGAMVMKWRYAPDGCFYCISDGPVLPADAEAAETFQLILDIVEKHRKSEPATVSHLRIEPRWAVMPTFVHGFEALRIPDAYTEPRSTLVVDLRPSEEGSLAQMRPKGRYNIRVARRHGVSVVEDTSERGLTDFMRHRLTARRHRIEAKPAAYFRTLFSLFSARQQLSIFFAEHEGRRLAAALIVYFGPRATYFFGGSLAVRRRVMCPYLLHFEIMRRAKARACEWYDLWGIAPDGELNHPWRDITAFKRKFGGVAISMVPTLDYVYDRKAYEIYRACASEIAKAPPIAGQNASSALSPL